MGIARVALGEDALVQIRQRRVRAGVGELHRLLAEFVDLPADLLQPLLVDDALVEHVLGEARNRVPLAPQLLLGAGPVELRFEDVGFGYGPDRPVLSGVSFAVAPGTRLAVVGASGAGKSTLFSLIMRFHDPVTGRITLDGVDLRAGDAVAPRTVHEAILEGRRAAFSI